MKVLTANRRLAIMPAMKTCIKCGFSGDDRKFRSNRNTCRICESSISGEWAKNNREKKRMANNAYHHRNSAMRKVLTATYRNNHPLAYKAHIAVQTAIRNGTLKRKPCQECGSNRSHAHHDDYKRKLDVIWLCHTCHMIRHAMIAEDEQRKEKGE